MLKSQKSSFLKNEKGMAALELIPTLFIYMLLLNFSLGFFGIVHSGILQNIAARNYVFETFRHRSNVVYHRTNTKPFTRMGFRYSGIIRENMPDSQKFPAAPRPLAFASSFGGTDGEGVNLAGRGPASVKGETEIHNQRVPNLDESQRNQNVSVKSVWIKTVYGICLDSRCGD
ncbi:MAG: hypothetical protein ACK5Y2_06835 [Bdellovibrionales bacterium]